MWFYLLAILFFFVNHQNARRTSQSFSDYIINYFLFLVMSIIPTGYIMSELVAIDKPGFWGISLLVISVVTFFILRFTIPKNAFVLKKNYSVGNLKEFVSDLSVLEKFTFGILFSGFVICSLLNI